MCLAAGCLKAGPDYQQPETTAPPAFRQPAGTALVRTPAQVERWWRVFEDPLLSGLIKEAAAGNLDLAEAVARVEEARARVAVAGGRLWPAAQGDASVSSQRASENGAGLGGGVTETTYSLSGTASWELDLFGRVRRQVEAAVADYQASRFDQQGVRVALYSRVATTYLALRTVQARLASALQNISSQREVLRLTQTRFDNGLATALDVAQAQSVLASSQAAVPALRADLVRNLRSLELLLGRPPGALDAELLAPAPIPVPPASVAVGLPARLLNRRPDVHQAERNLAAATARVGVATAELYPRFSLAGTLGLAATEPGRLFNASSHFFSLGPSVTWSLFAGGALRAQVRAAEAITRQALAAYRRTVLNALHEAETAMADYQASLRQVAALKRTVKAASRTLQLAIGLYRDGLQDFQSVLDAQRSLFDFDNQLALAQGQASANLVQLYQALGGGWSPAAPARDRSQP
jgi:NodT family efflux transporter outer membrane factor (OMF) lipoprotein